MKAKIVFKSVLVLGLCYCMMQGVYGQNDTGRIPSSLPETAALFTLRGDVQEADTYTPIDKVSVEILGGSFTRTNASGEFRLRARVGDELIISHPDFEPVRYTIRDEQRIRVEVIPRPEAENEEEIVAEEMDEVGNLSKSDSRADNNRKTKKFRSGVNYLDMAQKVYEEDLSAGVEQVTRALDEARTDKERGVAYALLGTIFTHWKQYDLAITDFQLALETNEKIEWQMGLAKAYLLNKNYQESITEYTALKARVTTGAERLLILEQLGDAQREIGAYDEAITNYNETIELLNEIGIEGGSRLNIKIGEVYDLKGASQEADTFYGNAIQDAEEEDAADAARTKLKVADAFNKKQSYDKEISLRSEALNGFIIPSSDSIAISNEDVLTSQKQNYKIANALIGQQKVDEAIPFFEKSIDEAMTNNDIVIERDATRKLSEIYRDRGDYGKALDNYERYAFLVDADYALKQQEIGKAEQRAKIISDNRNRILSLEKDKKLNENRYQLAFQEQELNQGRNTRQQIIIAALIAVILLLLLTIMVSYRGYKQQKHVNNILALKGLRSQMNPHFIFNALNSVNSFIATSDERRANAYLSDFSKLMRSVLENSEEDFIPLSSEIDLIKKYTMLEHFRFKDKFDFEIKVDDDLKVDDFQIPPMLLQPYVENAVWHGLRYKEEKGKLDIYFGKKDQDTAVVIITDDGVGRTQSKALKTANQKKQRSKGMNNIKNRIAILNEMYGDRVAVEVEDLKADGQGTRVTMLLKK